MTRAALVVRLSCPLTAAFALVLSAIPARSQEQPVKRVANIVSVALEEYGKGIDDRGHLISAQEYQEAVDFLQDARTAADRLPGGRGDSARAVLDSIILAVADKRPPAVLSEWNRRFGATLGSEAALDLPKGPIDVAAGRAIYEKTCASCHGVSGLGDGPAAAALNPKPPAIGSSQEMETRSPALLYRILSVGVAGTPMVGFASSLSSDQRWNVVTYLISLRTNAAQIAEGEGIVAQR